MSKIGDMNNFHGWREIFNLLLSFSIPPPSLFLIFFFFTLIFYLNKKKHGKDTGRVAAPRTTTTTTTSVEERKSRAVTLVINLNANNNTTAIPCGQDASGEDNNADERSNPKERERESKRVTHKRESERFGILGIYFPVQFGEQWNT